MKIIILNLSRNTTQEQLSALFEIYGKVASCNLVMNQDKGTSKGFGFVEMADENEANIAIKTLHGKVVDGNKIRVKISDKAA